MLTLKTANVNKNRERYSCQSVYSVAHSAQFLPLFFQPQSTVLCVDVCVCVCVCVCIHVCVCVCLGSPHGAALNSVEELSATQQSSGPYLSSLSSFLSLPLTTHPLSLSTL